MGDILLILASVAIGILGLVLGLSHWLDELEALWGRGKRKTPAMRGICLFIGVGFLGAGIALAGLDISHSPAGIPGSSAGSLGRAEVANSPGRTQSTDASASGSRLADPLAPSPASSNGAGLASTPSTSRKPETMRDLQGTYGATSNGITTTLSIWGADEDTASGSLYSTNVGTSSCVVYMLGSQIRLLFLDLSEMVLRVGTGTLTFVDSGVVLRKQ